MSQLRYLCIGCGETYCTGNEHKCLPESRIYLKALPPAKKVKHAVSKQATAEGVREPLSASAGAKVQPAGSPSPHTSTTTVSTSSSHGVPLESISNQSTPVRKVMSQHFRCTFCLGAFTEVGLCTGNLILSDLAHHESVNHSISELR